MMKNLTQLNIHRAGRRKRRKIICLNVKTLTLTLENQIYGESWDPLLGLELNSPGLPGYRRIKGYRRTRDTEDPWIQENTGPDTGEYRDSGKYRDTGEPGI